MVREPALQDGSLGTGTYHTSLTNELNPQETLKGEKGKPAVLNGGRKRAAPTQQLALVPYPLILALLREPRQNPGAY